MRLHLRSVVSLLALVVSAAAHSQDISTEQVRFQKGKSSVRIEGGIVRGARIRYLLHARAGQVMNITIKSREDNAVFSVYMRAQYAKQPISDDLEMHLVTATEWTAKLSESGEYAVVVGGTRGNANYTLDIQIK